MDLKQGIETALMLGIAGLIIISIFVYGINNTANPTVSLENKTFTANNTYYSLGHPTANSDLALYYFYNTTFPISATYYSYDSTQIKVYANGTGTYPNITNGASTFYYASYTYQQPFTIWGVSYTSVLSVLVAIILLICIFIVWKSKK